MLSEFKTIYAIPGWGFSSQVFNCLLADDINIKGLDYYNAPVTNFSSIVNYLANIIPDSSVVIAWSFGGLLAIKLAELFPKKIKKLMLISSQPRFLADKGWSGIDAFYADKFIFRFARDANAQLKRFISLVGQPNSPVNNVLQKFCLLDHVAILSMQLQMLFKYDLRDYYKNLSCSVLHIFNKKDAVLNQNSHQLLALNPSVETFMLDEAGHAGFISHSKIYQKLIRECMF